MKFEDLVDMDMQIDDLRRFVDMVNHTDKFMKPGVSIPRGLLLQGSRYSNTDDVLIALREECHANFLHVAEDGSNLESIVETAKLNAPALIFLPCAYTSSTGVPPKCVDTMKSVSKMDRVWFVATTTNAHNMHPGVLNMGFSRNVVLLPDTSARAREHILREIGYKLKFENEQVIPFLAQCTTETSPDTLMFILNRAAFLAVSDSRETITRHDVTMAYLDRKYGPRSTLHISPEEMRICGYHEAGHAITCYCSILRNGFKFATIVPRGGAGGMVLRVGLCNLKDAAHMKAELVTTMGGLAAEEIINGAPSIGPHQDLVNAFKLARDMVCKYGMGPSGMACIHHDGVSSSFQPTTMSQSKQTMIEADVLALLEEAKKTALEILRERRWKMGLLAELLIRKPVVYAEDMAQLLDTPLSK